MVAVFHSASNTFNMQCFPYLPWGSRVAAVTSECEEIVSPLLSTNGALCLSLPVYWFSRTWLKFNCHAGWAGDKLLLSLTMDVGRSRRAVWCVPSGERHRTCVAFFSFFGSQNGRLLEAGYSQRWLERRNSSSSISLVSDDCGFRSGRVRTNGFRSREDKFTINLPAVCDNRFMKILNCTIGHTHTRQKCDLAVWDRSSHLYRDHGGLGVVRFNCILNRCFFKPNVRHLLLVRASNLTWTVTCGWKQFSAEHCRTNTPDLTDFLLNDVAVLVEPIVMVCLIYFKIKRFFFQR